jgi:aerobic carbon-monoxide dehydrogenase medium subunit
VKPSPFTYHAPHDLDAALSVLADVGHDGKVLAGGQSLIPLLNMRLAAPGHLVDINRIPGLAAVTTSEDGVHIGALARHADVERDEAAAAAVPLLRQALRLVAHPTIRNRGTTVGSIVHADPSGEMTAVISLLGGTVELARRGATRVVPAGEFFLGPLESAVEPGEMATGAFFPRQPAGTVTAFTEVARRHGDYAVCGVGVTVTLDADRRVQRLRAAYLSVSATPLVLDLTDAVAGVPADAADWEAAGRLATGQLDPEPDIHATADYRRHLAGVLTARAARQAVAPSAATPSREGSAA